MRRVLFSFLVFFMVFALVVGCATTGDPITDLRMQLDQAERLVLSTQVAIEILEAIAGPDPERTARLAELRVQLGAALERVRALRAALGEPALPADVEGAVKALGAEESLGSEANHRRRERRSTVAGMSLGQRPKADATLATRATEYRRLGDAAHGVPSRGRVVR